MYIISYFVSKSQWVFCTILLSYFVAIISRFFAPHFLSGDKGWGIDFYPLSYTIYPHLCLKKNFLLKKNTMSSRRNLRISKPQDARKWRNNWSTQNPLATFLKTPNITKPVIRRQAWKTELPALNICSNTPRLFPQRGAVSLSWARL